VDGAVLASLDFSRSGRSYSRSLVCNGLTVESETSGCLAADRPQT
jgi:hypothetical protein